MPAINIVKKYRNQSFYHVYNRGAYKHEIFMDPKDYEFFYELLRQEKNRTGVQIFVESLLPNHFHLQIFQENAYDMVSFMKSIAIRYTLYFNKKYDGSGRIFQGNYKASLLKGLKRIRENTEYILKNPLEAGYDYWPYVGRFQQYCEN